MEDSIDDEVDLGEVADRESAGGYGLSAFGPTMGIPMPQGRQIIPLTDLEIAKAIGASGSAMESSQWVHQRDEYRKQHLAAQASMANSSSREYAAYVSAMGKQQQRMDKMAEAQAKAQDPFLRAQKMYAQAGSLGGARTIAKSTGAALFQHGEIMELGPNIAFRVQPVGVVRRVNQAGQEETISLSQSIAEAGVSVVPFLGGDEDAKAFRRMVAMTNDLISRLDEIEKIASSPGAHTLYGTDSRSMLKQLEGNLAGAVQQLKSGSKSMAGVSDKEMEALADSVPSASSLFTRDKDAIIKADMTKRQIMNIVIRQARANGIELNLMDLRKKAGPNASQGAATSSTPPGVSNGKQSGTSVTAQPR